MTSGFCTSCGKPIVANAKFCTSCGKELPVATEKVPFRQEEISGKPKKVMSRQTKILYACITVILFSAFLYLFTEHLPGGAHPVIGNQPSVAMATMYMGQTIKAFPITAQIENGKVVFPLSLLQEHKIVEFDYQTESNTIPLLAFITAEGKLVTSFRMCEPCNSKTFSIEGMELACGHCETKWKLNNLEGIQGSCQKYPPDPIPSSVAGNQVQIQESIIKQWKLRI
jgi:hypothetical protein